MTDEANVITAVVTALPDIESQQKQQQQPPGAVVRNPSTYAGNPDEGKGLGITMFVLLIVAFITTFFIPIIAFICLIVTIIIASVLTCGCCCASDYSLQPNVKKFALGTLVSLVLMFVVQIIWLIGFWVANASEVSETGTISQSTMENSTTAAGEYSICLFMARNRWLQRIPPHSHKTFFSLFCHHYNINC